MDKSDQNLIPQLFRCPISLDLLEDPVTLCTGQTYDRPNIQKWLASGNLTCPVTMQKLHDPSFVPNHTLRHLIHHWLHNSLNNPLAALKFTLESQDTTFENKLHALEEIIVLLSDHNEYCSFKKSTAFIQLELLPLLLELVFGGTREDLVLSKLGCMNFIELALSCVLKLLPLCTSLEPLNIMKDESKLATFIVLFEKGSSSVKTSLCCLIESVASSSQTQELCCIVGNNYSHKLVHEIVQNSKVCEDAIRGISALCLLESNRESLVKGGAIEGIVTYLCERKQKKKKLVPVVALGILEKLLEVGSGREVLVNHPNGIETLVNMVFKVCDQECSESAVEVLLIACSDFGHAREKAIEAGVLTRLLLLLQSQCSTTTKSKARMLLKLLKSK